MQITNGSIEYEHPHKIADYQVPKAKVSLSFTLDGDDVEAALVKVGEMARQRAMAIATGQAPLTAPAPSPAPPAPVTKGRKAAAIFSATSPVTAAEEPTVLTAPAVDPFGQSDATAVPATSAAADTGASPPASSVIDPKLTEPGLTDACNRKVANLQGDARQMMINKLRELKAGYGAAPGMGFTAIPMERRAEFLAALQAL